MSSMPAALDERAASPRVRLDNRRRWFPDLGEVWRYRRLIVLFARRDITARYRQTVLGSLWLFAGPLVSAGLFSFVFGRIAGLPSGGNSYFLFSLAGLLAWNLFSGSLSGGSTSMTGNAGLITKIYFPRLVVPISTLSSALLNTALSFVVLMFLIVVTGAGIGAQLLLLPAWLLLAIVLAIGLAVGLTSLSVTFRDVNYATPLLTQLLLYLSPVAYSVKAVPEELQTIYLLNPLASIVEGCRWSLLPGSELPPTWAIVYSVVVACAVAVVGLSTFARREPGFADVV